MTLTAERRQSTAPQTAAIGAPAEPFADSRQQLLAAMAYVDLRVRWAVARARAHGLDPSDEFRGLYISEEHIDELLGRELGALWPDANVVAPGLAEWPAALAEARNRWVAQSEAGRKQGHALLLNELIEGFGLEPLEVDILLIALAPEIDPRYERIFAYLQDDVTKKRPSVDLVLNLLTDSFEEKLDRFPAAGGRRNRTFAGPSRFGRSVGRRRPPELAGRAASLVGRRAGQAIGRRAGRPEPARNRARCRARCRTDFRLSGRIRGRQTRRSRPSGHEISAAAD
jgi:hypothetical protein